MLLLGSLSRDVTTQLRGGRGGYCTTLSSDSSPNENSTPANLKVCCGAKSISRARAARLRGGACRRRANPDFWRILSCFGPFGHVPVRKNAFRHLCETGVAHLSPDTPPEPRETRRTAAWSAKRRKKPRFWRVWEAGRPRGPQHFFDISFTSP